MASITPFVGSSSRADPPPTDGYGLLRERRRLAIAARQQNPGGATRVIQPSQLPLFPVAPRLSPAEHLAKARARIAARRKRHALNEPPCPPAFSLTPPSPLRMGRRVLVKRVAPISPLAPVTHTRYKSNNLECLHHSRKGYPVEQTKPRKKDVNKVLIELRERIHKALRGKLAAAQATNDVGEQVDHQSEESSDGAETADLVVQPPEPASLSNNGDLEGLALNVQPSPPLRRSTRIRKPVLRYGFS
ncbi:hypothetical protein HDU89_004573 [Geranomyces variabilis]|nr:hypothetical protein HDU89_004573 [Geranomyces variabilis]